MSQADSPSASLPFDRPAPVPEVRRKSILARLLLVPVIALLLYFIGSQGRMLYKEWAGL